MALDLDWLLQHEDAVAAGGSPDLGRRILASRRLRVRDELRDDIHFGLLVLGSCLILFRRLKPYFC